MAKWESGSVAFLFDRVGEIELENKPDEMAELELIDAGVKDLEGENIITEVADLGKILKKVREMKLPILSS